MFYGLSLLPLLGESVTQALMGIGKIRLNPQGLAVVSNRFLCGSTVFAAKQPPGATGT